MTETPPHIRRAARRLRLVTLVAIAVLAIAFAFAAWILLAGRPADWPSLVIHADGLPPAPAAIALLLSGSLIALALFRLVALLRRIEGGAPFDTGGLRGFAFYLFLAVLASVFAPPLLGLVMGGDAVRQVSVSLGSDQALTLLVTGLLFLVARLLDEARRIADDASQIV